MCVKAYKITVEFRNYLLYSELYLSERDLVMPELRVTISERMDKLLEKIVEEDGLFTSKADLARFSMVHYLHTLGQLYTNEKSDR